MEWVRRAVLEIRLGQATVLRGARRALRQRNYAFAEELHIDTSAMQWIGQVHGARTYLCNTDTFTMAALRSTLRAQPRETPMRPINRIDLNLLGTFEAIYTQGGVSAAARHLHLSQSAISHALARLRIAFDDELFVRVGNAIVPTALARSVIDPVRDALQGVEQALIAAARFDPATSTRAFRIGLRQANEARVFADIVAHVVRAAPGATLASVNFRRSDVADELARGDLDLAIDVASDATAGLHAIPLQTDTMVVAARRGHPKIADAIDLATYLAADHVQASPRRSGPGLEDEGLAALGETRRVAIRCQNIWSAWQVVAQSDLILTLLGTHAATLLPVADNQILPLPFAITPRPLQLLWHPAAERDPGNIWLRQLVQEQVLAARSHA